MNKNVFCTYFNIGYLSRGVALYNSMEECIDNFKLYIFACDEACINNLKLMGLRNAIVIDVNQCIDAEAEKILSDREGKSFYWSLAPLTIFHVLNKYHEEWCTYVDADCYFYEDPCFVFDRMEELDKTVGIVEHNFCNEESKEQLCKENGRFCVEFNTFRNNSESLEVLKTWRKQCLEPCQTIAGGNAFGDQLYLNEWPQKYNCVYIVENKGIGMAPWNIMSTLETENLIMYHFHGLHFLGRHIVSLNIWNITNQRMDKRIYSLYKDYLKKIQLTESKILFEDSLDSNKTSFSSKISSYVEKLKGRKEKSIIQLLNNIMWI